MSKLRSIQKLQEMPPYEIAMIIRNEHPQIIAQICFNMDEKITSEVLSYFSERLRNDVVLRVSVLSNIDKYWLMRFDEALLYTLNNNTSRIVYQKGLEKSADILKHCDPDHTVSILGSIMEYDPDLHESIQNQMMLFEDIFELSPEDLTTLINYVELDDFIISLKGMNKSVVTKLTHSLSEEYNKKLIDRINVLEHTKHRISHIVAMRSEILKSLRYLIDTDKITSTTNEWI